MDDVRVPSLTAHCGLNCSTCKIFLATRENDAARKNALKEEIAAIILERYGRQMSVNQITDCDGCRAEGGRLFSGCLECEIRKCAIEKKVESCAFCTDYPCENLHRFVLSEAVDRSPEEA